MGEGVLSQMGTGKGWRRVFGGAPPAEAEASSDAGGDYAAVALELLKRCEDLHQEWLEQLDEQRRHERLANAAAVYHWYLSSVRDRLQDLQAPPTLSVWHEGLVGAVEAALRATQLLSSGYRFHNIRRICDGGVLLEEAQAQARAVREALAPLALPPPVEAATS